MSNVSWVCSGGPLAPFADGYGAELARLGFTHHSVVTHVVLMGQLSRWMPDAGIVAGDLTEDRVQGFFDARRAGGQNRVPTARTLVPLFGYLRSCGIVPPPPGVVPAPLEDLLSRCRRYLLQGRGLAPSTVVSYEGTARLFLPERTLAGGSDTGVEGLCGAGVTGFLLRECSRLAVGSARNRGNSPAVLAGAHAGGRQRHRGGGPVRSRRDRVLAPRVFPARGRVSQEQGEPPAVAAAVSPIRRRDRGGPRVGRAARGRLARHLAASRADGQRCRRAVAGLRPVTAGRAAGLRHLDPAAPPGAAGLRGRESGTR